MAYLRLIAPRFVALCARLAGRVDLMSSRDPLVQRLEAAQPDRDELNRTLVRSQVMTALFTTEVAAPTVGRFRLKTKLGAGGQGVVFAARDPELNRDVAVKLVRVHSLAEREATLDEAKALARLSHPNVVAIYDVGVVDEQVYLVMEFVGGRTLRAYAQENGRTYRDVLRAYKKAAAGLAAAHRGGLVHRDFKPDNAVIDDQDRVRIIDFGLAIEDGSEATKGGGTPGYRAPEQAAHGLVGVSADQYALCHSLREAIDMTVDGDRARWLEPILKRGCEPDPADRFASIDELTAALDRDPRRLWRRRALAVGAASTIAVAFAVGATVFGTSETEDTCDKGKAALASVWPTNARVQAQQHLADLGDYGALVASRIEEGTATFSDEWSSVHRNSCLEHRRGESSDTLLDTKMQCLQNQRQAFSSLRAVVERSGASSLAGVVLALNSLPPPGSCGELRLLAGEEIIPQHLLKPVAKIQEQLADLRVKIAAGQYASADTLGLELEQQARRLGYPPTLADVLLLRGRLAIAKDSLADAKSPLAEATAIALTAGMDSTATEAWARRAWVDGMTDDATQALAGVELIEALAKRIERASFPNALLRNNIGSIYIAKGDYVAARYELRRAVEIARQVEGPNALELVNTRGNLAIVTDDVDERDALAAESVAMFTKLVGSSHPHTLAALLNQGKLRRSASEARTFVQPACNTLAKFHPLLRRSVAGCYLELGWLEEEVGNRVAAQEAMAQAVDFGDTSSPAQGLAQLWTGQVDEALQTLSDVSKNNSVFDGAPWWRVLVAAESNMALGYAYLEKDRRKGQELLRESVVLLEGIESPIPTVLRRISLARTWLAQE